MIHTNVLLLPTCLTFARYFFFLPVIASSIMIILSALVITWPFNLQQQMNMKEEIKLDTRSLQEVDFCSCPEIKPKNRKLTSPRTLSLSAVEDRSMLSRTHEIQIRTLLPAVVMRLTFRNLLARVIFTRRAGIRHKAHARLYRSEFYQPEWYWYLFFLLKKQWVSTSFWLIK